MVCRTSCIIAGAFIFSSIFLSMRVDKQTLKDPLFQKLSEQNKQRYLTITNERRNIYLKGFGLGFIMSVLFLLVAYHQGKKLKTLTKMCVVLAISFTANYFYYILSPKTDYMILHLNTPNERMAWLNIYKTMQFNYHLGFVLGLIGMMFVGKSIC